MSLTKKNFRRATFFVRAGDTVVVNAGNNKGTQGKVMRVDRAKQRVLVEGVNKVWKHLRRSQENPHGARIQKEAPIHMSNVQVVCPACNKPTRVTWSTENDVKFRVCKKCSKPLGQG
jgi:large subunit ribosomal protein L24